MYIVSLQKRDLLCNLSQFIQRQNLSPQEFWETFGKESEWQIKASKLVLM
jgi:hypothetical protein